MLIDTHTHLLSKKYIKTTEEIIEDAFNNDVTKIINIGCNFIEIENALNIARNFSNVYATAGLYPHLKKFDKYLEFSLDEKIQLLEEYAKNPKVVAIGECGLDYSEPNPEIEEKVNKEDQIELFVKQIELAKTINKPIIIHSRDALDDTLEILNNYFCGDNLNGVWHCFSYDMQIFEKVKNLGFMISVGGLVTYSSLKDLKNVVKNMPLESLLLETDAPYLIPSQAKNQGLNINEPQYIKIIAEYIAKIRNEDYFEIEAQTTNNAERLFQI